MGAANLLSGAIILAAGILITYFASHMTYMSEYGPGPGLLPFWIGIALSACAVLTIIKAARQCKSKGDSFFQPRTRQVLIILAFLVITILLIPLLGLSVALALFTGSTMRTSGRHGWILCAVMAAGTAAAVWIIFGSMLDIPLPKGFIGF